MSTQTYTGTLDIIEWPLSLFFGEDPARTLGQLLPFRRFGPVRLTTVCSPMEWAKALHPCEGSELPDREQVIAKLTEPTGGA